MFSTSDELDEVSFTQIFMATTITAFVAPGENGVANTNFYPNFLDVSAILELDWCPFTLNWVFIMHQEIPT
jgi:hypothetical protein